jgi:hypothetical protein
MEDTKMSENQSWAPEVLVEGKWSRNQVRLASKEEAEACALDVFRTWSSALSYRATEATEPANYRWTGIKLEPIVVMPPAEPAIDVVDCIMRWEDGSMDEAEELTFFNYLVNTKMIASLQGMYGRRARALGLID